MLLTRPDSQSSSYAGLDGFSCGNVDPQPPGSVGEELIEMTDEVMFGMEFAASIPTDAFFSCRIGTSRGTAGPSFAATSLSSAEKECTGKMDMQSHVGHNKTRSTTASQNQPNSRPPASLGSFDLNPAQPRSQTPPDVLHNIG